MEKSVRPLALGAGIQKLRFSIGHADLTDADTSQAIALFTLGPNDAIMGVRIKHSEAFTGGSVSSCTVSVGGATDGVAAYATAFNIYQAVAATTLQWSQCLKNGTAASAGQVVSATFTSGGDNLSSLTAGAVDIDIYVLTDTVKALS